MGDSRAEIRMGSSLSTAMTAITLKFLLGENMRVKIKAKKKVKAILLIKRLNGQKGGLKTAALYSHEDRVKWGENGGSSTLSRYGRDYFKHIRGMRKRYPKTIVRGKKQVQAA